MVLESWSVSVPSASELRKAKEEKKNRWGAHSAKNKKAAKLRNILSKPRKYSHFDVCSFLECLKREEGEIEMLKAIREPNRNGKSAIHFACQFGYEPETIKFLLDIGAEVDTCTNRGHTPLIFACGRGKDDNVLALLKYASPNTKIITVGGDSALSMAKGRVRDEVYKLLERADEVCSGEVMDFSTNQVAIMAQVEHVKCCKHCQESGRWDEYFAEEHKDMALLKASENQPIVKLEQNIIQPLEQKDLVAVRSVLLEFALRVIQNSKSYLKIEKGLTEALIRITDSKEKLCTILQACSEKGLGLFLLEKSRLIRFSAADKRPIRIVLKALLNSLEAKKQTTLEETSASEIISHCEENMIALEVLVRKRILNAQDKIEVDLLWKTFVKERKAGALDSETFHEITYVSCQKNAKKAGNSFTLRLARLFEIASLLDRNLFSDYVSDLFSIATWAEMDKELHALIVSNPSLKFDGKVVQYLDAFHDKEIETVESVTLYEAYRPRICGPLPLTALQGNYHWIDSKHDLEILFDFVKSLGGNECVHLPVGIDTEWTTEGKISCIQVSAGEDTTWIVDAHPITLHENKDYHLVLQQFLIFMFQRKNIELIGFSFKHDLSRLQDILLDHEVTLPMIFDLQKLAMKVKPLPKGLQPSLSRVCKVWLGEHLDKEFQTSNWDTRPLSHEQLLYAALDAQIIIRLNRIMKVTEKL
mmetsp:Transcript_1471/g.1957  ORF Transcript_1471/g.1957 Transcript_1471/m.1957 type:complete len:703 (-) Transcript_1471:151-2259(-)|eukprot:CAMPEP_0204876592 /NCGR_PEP_ID=MMETSP1348-20121228/47724_1 /ASSEMBLY_ACC=CAM_ASM_000700 /TAXON_ID=215587 /ORGANISM="Aplanochytrium stocchinoi, Strain GSBS06" /LENGTH=702 /DNA_ID=CAMNT_0052033369 /DNA_START=503 /DNA_END=2611 /DNA_ORIENTATION=+